MHSSLIGKVEKANRYARELDRITIDRLSLTFRGDNDTHHVGLDAGQWRCTCHYFESWGSCVHLLALQKVYRRDAARGGPGLDLRRGPERRPDRLTCGRRGRAGAPRALSGARRRTAPRGRRRWPAGRRAASRAAVVDGRALIEPSSAAQATARRWPVGSRANGSPCDVPSGGVDRARATSRRRPASRPCRGSTTGAPWAGHRRDASCRRPTSPGAGRRPAVGRPRRSSCRRWPTSAPRRRRSRRPRDRRRSRPAARPRPVDRARSRTRSRPTGRRARRARVGRQQSPASVANRPPSGSQVAKQSGRPASSPVGIRGLDRPPGERLAEMDGVARRGRAGGQRGGQDVGPAGRDPGRVALGKRDRDARVPLGPSPERRCRRRRPPARAGRPGAALGRRVRLAQPASSTCDRTRPARGRRRGGGAAGRERRAEVGSASAREVCHADASRSAHVELPVVGRRAQVVREPDVDLDRPRPGAGRGEGDRRRPPARARSPRRRPSVPAGHATAVQAAIGDAVGEGRPSAARPRRPRSASRAATGCPIRRRPR